jgi:hypothetical protein
VASFIAHTEATTGAELSRFVKDEFDAFLECGILPQLMMALSVVSKVPESPSKREGSPRRSNGAAFPFREFA